MENCGLIALVYGEAMLLGGGVVACSFIGYKNILVRDWRVRQRLRKALGKL